MKTVQIYVFQGRKSHRWQWPYPKLSVPKADLAFERSKTGRTFKDLVKKQNKKQ